MFTSNIYVCIYISVCVYVYVYASIARFAQHHAFPHPKLLSLPLGVRRTSSTILTPLLEELRLLVLEDELVSNRFIVSMYKYDTAHFACM
jgi:hypothetical protein